MSAGPVYPYRDRRLDHVAADPFEAAAMIVFWEAPTSPRVVLQANFGPRYGERNDILEGETIL